MKPGLPVICLVAMLSTQFASAEDAAFEQTVLPILTKHCGDCHGNGESESGLNLMSREKLLYGSKASRVIAPGKSSASLLTQLIAKGSKPHMPPEGQLSDAEIAAIEKWIDELRLKTGELPERPTSARGRDHWAFIPPVRHEPPATKNSDWARTPVDKFVLDKLERANLAPSPPASKAELIRRAYFDLVGLPPSPEEVLAFVDDTSESTYEQLLDRLLTSPAYGERWGRHWLDLARYADSSGFHDDLDRPHAWRYRDYVIKSLNDDKPYGQFVREQLAGDELAARDVQMLAATGFCRNGPSNDNNMGPEKEKYRLDQMDDVISTTSAVFLGLTVGCARCHDHKYDPILQSDYYRFLAIFDNLVNKTLPLDANGQVLENVEKKTPKSAIMAVTDRGGVPRNTYLLYRGDVQNRGPQVEPGLPVVLTSRPLEFAEADKEAKTTGRRAVLADWIASPDNPLSWRVMANRIWQHHFGAGLVATPSNFGLTGSPPTHPELLDWLALELVAQGGRFKPIHKQLMMSATYRQSSQWNKAAAAIDPQNRLLWRANKRRLEAEAIRDSVLSVAGTLNPAMGGPGIRPRIPADILVASQRNKWPVVEHEGPEHWRRSVYVYVKRQLLLPMLELFDAPNANQTCDRRDESVVPTQALVMMNDEFTQDQATHFAQRVVRETSEDLNKQAERALWLALAHQPSEARVAEAVAFLEQQAAAHRRAGQIEAEADRQALADLCHVLLNCNEFVYVD